jgi:nitroreductase
MNETMNTLLKRRSIRKYKPEQITDEELNQVLEAGMYAPTAANQQPAILIVIQNKEMRERVMKMNVAVMGKEGMDPYYGAPTIVLVLADKNAIAPVEDASLVIGNMCNAAYSLGLGSCWIHREKQMFESEEGKALLKELGVKGDYIGVGSCILGYPAMDLPQPAPRKEGYVVMVK